MVRALNYASVHNKFAGTIATKEYVREPAGVFTQMEKAELHLKGGAKKDPCDGRQPQGVQSE